MGKPFVSDENVYLFIENIIKRGAEQQKEIGSLKADLDKLASDLSDLRNTFIPGG